MATLVVSQSKPRISLMFSGNNKLSLITTFMFIDVLPCGYTVVAASPGVRPKSIYQVVDN